MDVLVLLSKEAASRSNGLKRPRRQAVRGVLGIHRQRGRSVAVPFTSKVAAGVVVPMPTLPPDSKMADGSIARPR